MVATPLVAVAAVLNHLRLQDPVPPASDAGAGAGGEITGIFLSAAIVIVACHVFGGLAERLGQPRVVGEILAGLVLGPSVLGALAPGTVELLFPPEVRAQLSGLAQIGLVLFMFGVGRELAAMRLRSTAARPLLVCQASLLVPLAVGVVAAVALIGPYKPDGTNAILFALFIGCALSITAVPVLARILSEAGMARTRPGRISLFCASLGDGVSWILLTFIVAMSQGAGGSSAVVALLGAAGFGAVMLGPLRVYGARWAARGVDAGVHAHRVLTVLVVCVAAAAAVTSALGVHQLIGALLVGAAWPANGGAAGRATELAWTVQSVLMPFFFFGFGLTIDLTMLADPAHLPVLCALLLIAVASKVLGPGLCARLTGMGWRESFALGALLNARGLTELVVLQVGYQAGLIGDELFIVLTAVALLTTVMTAPLLRLTGTSFPDDQGDRAERTDRAPDGEHGSPQPVSRSLNTA